MYMRYKQCDKTNQLATKKHENAAPMAPYTLDFGVQKTSAAALNRGKAAATTDADAR